jgi:hypothetical protein
MNRNLIAVTVIAAGVGLGVAPVASSESCAVDGQTFTTPAGLFYTCAGGRQWEGQIIPSGVQVNPCVSGQMFTAFNGYAFKCVAGRLLWSEPRDIPIQTQQPTPTSTSNPTVFTAAIPGDGVFIVGIDVQPGMYKSAGPTRGTYCWWYRHSTIGTQGSSAGDVIQDGNSAGPQYVVIAPSDATFETEQCSTWVRVK